MSLPAWITLAIIGWVLFALLMGALCLGRRSDDADDFARRLSDGDEGLIRRELEAVGEEDPWLAEMCRRAGRDPDLGVFAGGRPGEVRRPHDA